MKKLSIYLAFLLIILTFTSCTYEKLQTTEQKAVSVEENKEEVIEKKASKEEKDIEEIKEEAQDEVKEETQEEPKEEIKVEPKIETIRIKAFGDIMFHMPQIRYAQKYGDRFNFSESFSEVKDFLSDADLTIANFETTTNPNRPNSGFPMFNAPVDVFLDIKDAGIDLLSTVNNHTLDTGVEGILSTIEKLQAEGLKNFGTGKPGEDKSAVIDLKGIKVGVIGFTESLNGLDSLLKTDEEKTMVNRMVEDNIKADIEKLKNDSCDIVIVYPHWGVEYSSTPSEAQRELAKKILEWGGDIIIGSHPHVVQGTEKYTTSDGRKCFIAYSCGNFLSNQRKETMNLEKALNLKNGERCEQNIGFELVIEKNFDENKVEIKDVIYHPMWVGLRDGQFGRVVKSHLCKDFLEGGEKFDQVDDYTRSRIIDAFEKTMETTKLISE